MDIFMTAVSIFCLFGVLLYPPAVLCIEYLKATSKTKTITAGQRILACCPLVNLIVTGKALYGKAPVQIVLTIIAGICAIFRFFVITVIYTSPLLLLLSVYGSFLMIVCVWISTSFTALQVAILTRTSGLTKLLCILLPPLGTFWVAKGIASYITALETKLNGTFDSHTA